MEEFLSIIIEIILAAFLLFAISTSEAEEKNEKNEETTIYCEQLYSSSAEINEIKAELKTAHIACP